MGEIADAMINGDFDFYTGEYLGRGHGFPRTKKNPDFRRRGARFRNDSFTERQAFNGVHLYLRDKGYKNADRQDQIIKQYGIDKNITVPNKRMITRLCLEIQKDFKSFAQYVNENITALNQTR